MKKRHIVKVNAHSYAHLVLHMMDGDMTCEELAEATGLHLLTVYQYARELHKVGAAHIARFDADVRGRHTIKVYKIGKAKDAKRIRMTAAERTAAYRARKAAAHMAQVTAGRAEYVQQANGRLRFNHVQQEEV